MNTFPLGNPRGSSKQPSLRKQPWDTHIGKIQTTSIWIRKKLLTAKFSDRDI